MRDKKRVLLFFTGSYPFGRQEAFIENEIGFLAKAFDQVFVLPQTSSPTSRKVPSNVLVQELPEPRGWRKGLAIIANAARTWMFWMSLGEAVQGSQPLYRIRTLASYVGLARLYKDFVLREVLLDLPKGTEISLYSYWLDRNALTMVMLRGLIDARSVVARVHRFDVYEERNPDSYLPLRRVLLKGIDSIHSISADAAEYLKARYPDCGTYKVSRLGTVRDKSAHPEAVQDGLHILSVSNVIPVKRVAMIADSIIDFAMRSPAILIRWTHFGDGPLFADLQRKVHEINLPNLIIDLQGGRLNSEIKSFYEEYRVDLFINLSESEGIPVSFMEAMSYFVPVIATNVGGVGEILDEDCAYLLTADVSAIQVADKLCEIQADRKQLERLALSAQEAWAEKYNAQVNYPKFCAALLGEVK